MIVDDEWWENETNARLANNRKLIRLRRADQYLLKAVGEDSWRRKLQFIGLALEEIDKVADTWPAPSPDRRVTQ